jgi:hypothetical protein
MSYIVKNCPAYEYNEEWDHHICKRNLAVYETTCDTCPECSDCTMKQIVELCKEIKCPCEFKGADCWECTESGAKRLTDRILQLLDVQEVE